MPFDRKKSYEMWRKQHPDATDAEIVEKVNHAHHWHLESREKRVSKYDLPRLLERIFWAILFLILAILFAPKLHAQQVTVHGIAKGTTTPNTATVEASDANHNSLDVVCVSGCSGGGSSSSVTVNDPTVTTQKLAVDAAGKIGINNFPASQAVTGTFWQATQPVSGTFWQATQPVSIATMPSTPVTGTFWQTTQPVSIATMPSTPVTGTFWQTTQPISSTQLPAALDGSGYFKVHEQGTANVSVQNASIPVTGTFWQATQPVSLASLPALTAGSATIGKVNLLGNSGATLDATLAPGTAPTNGIGIVGTYNPTLPTATTGQSVGLQVDVNGMLMTDSNYIRGVAISTAAAGVQLVGVEGHAGGPVDANTNAAMPTAQIWQVPAPTTASGAAVSVTTSATVTASVNLKASAGNVYGVFALNGAASTCWIQFINSASAGTLGTGVIFSVPLPASTTQPIWITLPYPIAFSTGIAVGIATTNTGSTACGTGGNLTTFYK